MILNKQYPSGLKQMDKDKRDEDSKEEDNKEEESPLPPEEQLVIEALEELKPTVKDDRVLAIEIHKIDFFFDGFVDNSSLS